MAKDKPTKAAEPKPEPELMQPAPVPHNRAVKSGQVRVRLVRHARIHGEWLEANSEAMVEEETAKLYPTIYQILP